MSNLGDILRQVVCIPSQIPDDWSFLKLRDICSPKQWRTISSSEMTKTGYPVFGANGFVGFYHEYNHKHEAVAITCRGNTCGTINKIPPKTYITGNSMALDDIKAAVVAKNYLYYALTYRGVGDSISGSAQPQITGAGLRSIEFPAPPLPEQQKIATILSFVDNVIETTRAQIDKLKHLKTGMMQELLTKGIGSGGVPHTEFKDSPVGRIPASWNVFEIGEVASQVKPGPFGSSLTKAMYVEKGYKVYGQEQVISGDFKVGDYFIDQAKYDELGAFKVASGDILISLVGTFGQVAVVPENYEAGIINPRLLKIRFPLNNVNSEFIAQQLRSEFVLNQLKRLQQGGTMGVLSATTVKPVKLIVPPLEEQEMIGNSARSVDRAISKKLLALRSVLNLKKALMQDLLTGKVRVSTDENKKEPVVA